MPAAPDGFLDLIDPSEGWLDLSGWILGQQGVLADAVEFTGPQGAKLEALTMKRPDLEAAFPDHRRAGRAGFDIRLPADRFSVNGQFDCTMRAIKGDHTEFTCRIVARRDAPDDAAPQWRDRSLYV